MDGIQIWLLGQNQPAPPVPYSQAIDQVRRRIEQAYIDVGLWPEVRIVGKVRVYPPFNTSPLTRCKFDHAPKRDPDAIAVFDAIRASNLDEEGWPEETDEDFVEAHKKRLATIRIMDSKR